MRAEYQQYKRLHFRSASIGITPRDRALLATAAMSFRAPQALWAVVPIPDFRLRQFL